MRDAASKLGDNVSAKVADAGDPQAMKQLMTPVKQESGGIDVLFPNAGLALFTPVSEQALDGYDELMRVNVKGPQFTLQASRPLVQTPIFGKMGQSPRQLQAMETHVRLNAR